MFGSMFYDRVPCDYSNPAVAAVRLSLAIESDHSCIVDMRRVMPVSGYIFACGGSGNCRKTCNQIGATGTSE